MLIVALSLNFIILRVVMMNAVISHNYYFELNRNFTRLHFLVTYDVNKKMSFWGQARWDIVTPPRAS
jgi:hypothetical protein